MRNIVKTVVILLLLCAAARADDINGKVSDLSGHSTDLPPPGERFNVIASTEPMTSEDYERGYYTGRKTELPKNVVQDNLCPSGWKKSEFFIICESTKPSISNEDGWGFYSERSTKAEYLEVCPDNGLLRVRQK